MQLEAQRIAERLAALPKPQRLTLLRRLAEQGMDASSLPIVPFRRDEPLPASYAQRGLWLTWRMAPHSAAYNMAGTLVLEGALDAQAMAAAVDDLNARHEVLRTVFRVDADGELVQLPQPAALGILQRDDLSALAPSERELQARERVGGHARQPFDLEAGPAWRVLLLKLDNRTHWLSIIAHHIVADGWSEPVLVQDLAAMYEARAAGVAPVLPPMPIQFADHAAWQHEWSTAGETERQLAHWKQRLAGAAPSLPLPLDRPRPAQRGDAGAIHRFVLSGALAADIRRLADANGSTVFMVMLALLKLVLARRCGTGDICVGTPVADRGRAETHRLVGYLTNVLVLRSQVDLRAGFRSLLATVRGTVLDAHAHADCPFDLLVSALAQEREAGVHPLFQVKCTEQQDAAGLDRFGALSMRPHGAEAVYAHFDVSLDFTVRAHEIDCELGYAVDVFDAATVAGLAGLLVEMAQRVTAAPDQSLSELLPAVALSQVQGETRGAGDDVLACWERHVAAAGDAPALRCEEELLTRADLDARAQALGGQLTARGVGPEVRVGVHAPRSIDLVVGLLAVLKAGGVYVPLDPALPAGRLAYQVQDSGMAWLLSADVPAWNPQVPVLPFTPASGTDAPQDWLAAKTSPRQGAYLIYTSGSTGRPKGVAVDRGALANYVHGVLERLDLPDGATSMAMVSTVAADLGHTVLFGALCAGRLLHLVSAERAFDPDRFAEYMSLHHVDVLKIVPSHLQALLNAGQPADVLPRHSLVLGGEATRWPLLDRIAALRPSLRVLNHYGPTETTVGILTQEAAQALRTAATLPVGRPLPNSAVHVLDGNLEPVPHGTAGELYLGGAGLAQGYVGRPGMTAERFVPHPFAMGERLYRSGDRVRLLPNASLEFLGRVDDQVKVRGYRVELQEIARTLLALPGVREAEVVAREGDEGSTRLLGYVVVAAGASVDGETLRAQLLQRLPEYMVPAAITALEAMPLNANGKLDRKALPEPETLREQAHEAPVGTVEETLAAIWEEVLGVQRIGRQDNFFVLGGDSILSLKVVARARKRGVPLSPRQLFEAGNLSALAAAVAGASGDDTSKTPADTAIPLLGAAQRALPLPPSYAQLRQWFLWKLDEQSTAYYIAGALKLEGALDEAALRGSFEALVARHEALRTVFRVNADGVPEQILREHMELSIPLIDLSQVEPGERQAQARQQALRVSETPFDLGEGPLLRAALIRLDAREHILVVVMHHIVSDGWSLQLVVDEFVAQYRARVLGEPLQQPALPIQYADYAAWQRQWLEAGERERQLAYWTAQLGGPQPVLQLTTDHPRQAEANYHAARHGIELPAALVQSLQRRAQAQGATLFMTLLAGWQALLHRYTGHSDLRVGVPIANRHRVETEGVVGLFVNTQVLRGTVQGRMSLEQLLAQARDTALQAQAHQDLPFEQLVEALQPERSLGQSPLFQVMYNHQREDYRALTQLPGLSLHSYELGEQAAQFELTLDTAEKPDGSVWASWSYARELFEAGSIERLAGHYLAVLQALAETPQSAVGDIELLGESEKSQLRQWGVNEQTYGNTQPVHRQIEQQVQRTPEAVALVFGEEQLSYRELNTRANRLAHRLIALGVGAETRVGLALERSVEMVVGLLAILKAGGAYVPLDPEYPAERLAYMVQDSGIALVLAQHQSREQGQGRGEVPVLALDTLVLDGEPASDPATEVHGQQLAYVIYTSGSTGRPKGVMVRQHALAHFIRSMQQAPGLSAQDTLVAVTSLSFDIAALELYLPLTVGARIVLASRETTRDGIALAQLVEHSRATVLQSTPAGWRMLRAAGWPSKPLHQFKGLCGGEALQPDLAQDLHTLGVELWNMYGPTETTIWSAAARVTGASPDVSGAIAATQLYVLDAGLRPVAANVPGELYLGGVGLARGYAGRAALTAERFVADPFDETASGARLYRTGDLVRWRANGRLEFLGRLDHQVKIRGFRIELGEIEAQLLAQPGVREAVVVAQETGTGARLLAYIAAREGAAIDVGELREQLGKSLPEYMVPSAIVRLEKLPLNGNGKVDRKALPQVEAQGERDYEAPRGEVEEALAAIWAEVLGVQRVGRGDNFFELGGHSLLAAQMVARLRAAFVIDLKLRKVFELPALRDLSACVSDMLARPEPRSEAESLLAVPRSATMSLSPAQRRLWAVDRLVRSSDARDRAAYNMSGALRLDGAIDLDALRAAFGTLVVRHEILRTSYREDEDGEPVAVIAEQLAVDVPLVDLSDNAVEGLKECVQAAVQAHAGQVFDLASGPVLRAAVLRLSATQHVLLLSVHHIAFDGWSEAVFTKDFVALYAAFQAKAVPADQPILPPLSIQYADYAQWHARRLDETLAADTAFWQSYLAGAPARSSLPGDRPSSPSASGEGDVLELSVPRALADALAGLARVQGVSLFTLLLAAFELLAHRQSQSEDLVIGTDVAGRNHPALEDLMGFFVNVLPLRSRLGKGMDFLQWLSCTQTAVFDALEHQEMPFDHIVEVSGVARNRQHMPLVQMLFVMQNVPESRFHLPGLQIERIPRASIQTKFELAVFVSEVPEGLRADWVFPGDLYRRGTIQRAAAAWRDLLQQIAAAPQTLIENFVIPPIQELPMRTEPISPTPMLKAGKLDKLKKLTTIMEAPQQHRTPDARVLTSFLSPQRQFPIVMQPSGPGLDAVAWAREQKDFIETALRRHGGILFRNFGLRTPQDFEAFAETIEPQLYGGYGDLPKKEGGRNTYRSTPYPEREMILFHNESAHLDRWPRKQWFFCELPSPVGGATPIVDCREMLRRLPPALVDKLERQQLLYVRTFTRRLDVSWQDFFKTDVRADVEQRLAAVGTDWNWLDGDNLQTRTRCPAVIRHPVTGERAFFNQVQLHHVHCLEPEVREDLLSMVGLERMPRHVYYGDGTPIDSETMDIIGRAYEDCAVRFDWKQGDVVMLDNMLAAHARDPFEGPRKIVVAMGEMFERARLDAMDVPAAPIPEFLE